MCLRGMPWLLVISLCYLNDVSEKTTLWSHTDVLGGWTDSGDSFSTGRNIELGYFIEISKHVVVIINYNYIKEETSGLVIAVDFSAFKRLFAR